jgi:DNA-binding NtrC family response regulator
MISQMKISIVDDEKDMRESITQWLSLSGYTTESFEKASNALKSIGKEHPGIVISDIKMPGMDGIEFLKKLMIKDSTLPVILITGHGDVGMAVEAMHLGAYDFLEKPFDPNRILEITKRALHTRKLILDNRSLRRELSDGTVLLRKLIGSSNEIKQLREDILDLGRADGHIFINGETGTGKNLVAQAIHACGSRQGRNFILFDCAAHSKTDIEKILFKGSIKNNEKSIINQAVSGTLCLEGIEHMPEECQSKLLALINSQDNEQTSSIRIITISETANGIIKNTKIIPALFFRLSTLNINLSPLRKRGNDILELFNRFLDIYSEEYGYEPPIITAIEAAQLLQAPWPGNVRQLINLAEKAILQNFKSDSSLTKLLMEEINVTTQKSEEVNGKPLKEHVEAFEKMLIDNTMKRNKGSITSVMKELGLPRRTLNEKMAKYQLSRSNYL